MVQIDQDRSPKTHTYTFLAQVAETIK